MSQAERSCSRASPARIPHLACREVYPDYDAVPCATFEDAFAAVATGEAELGMIPIENSVAGRVADIHHLMPTSGLHIIGEHFLPVHHQLLAPKGATLEDDQDGREPRPRARPVPQDHPRSSASRPIVAADTAGAAREVAEAGDKTRAAIASRLAAEIYGLDILARGRRGRGAQHHALHRPVARGRSGRRTATARSITTFVFRVRNVPAALYKALGGFATNGVNMTKLESYMIEGNFFATQFYADVEGHPGRPRRWRSRSRSSRSSPRS